LDELAPSAFASDSNTPGKNTLILFDIDGTLLTTGGAGERALRHAVRECFAIEEDFFSIPIAGQTDSGIARGIFERHGLDHAELERFYSVYLDRLAKELGKSSGALMPGILPLLKVLKANSSVALALLTGNLARGAELKLQNYGIWDFFEFGAFADDHCDRNELGAFARQRAFEKHGIEFEPNRIFVIGDTPHDIACGQAIGAQTIAVATGGCTLEKLAQHDADFVFKDLSDLAAVLAALGV
jgi:phosphoglycolate phosphatase